MDENGQWNGMVKELVEKVCAKNIRNHPFLLPSPKKKKIYICILLAC